MIHCQYVLLKVTKFWHQQGTGSVVPHAVDIVESPCRQLSCIGEPRVLRVTLFDLSLKLSWVL